MLHDINKKALEKTKSTAEKYKENLPVRIKKTLRKNEKLNILGSNTCAFIY